MTARIPFALIGVVLLVGSATLVGTLDDPVVSEPAVEGALDRVSAESQSALREAATSAAREAARDPLTVRANTSYGRVLNRSAPFRDSLRIRLYLRARDRPHRISGPTHGVFVRASLPGVGSPSDLRAAKRRVHVSRATNRTGLRIRIENVSIVARRGGRAVGRRTVSPTLVVPTPTLAVHDRVERFERLLDAGPLEPGLGRQLTGRLYPIVWARGYAQYGGAPIENVLGNRHVALATNGGVLTLQASVFGHSDPVGRAVARRGVLTTAAQDVLAATRFPAVGYLDRAQEKAILQPGSAAHLPATAVDPAGPGPESEITIAVNRTADRAFLDTDDVLNRTLRRTYSARVGLTQRVRTVGHQTTGSSGPPGSEWSLADVEERTHTTVSDREGGPATGLVPAGRHHLATDRRTVTHRRTTIRQWQKDGETERTVRRIVERTAVTLVLSGNHTLGPAPRRPIATVHDPGGPLDGPNMADVGATARDRLLGERGGVDRLAKRAAAGANVTDVVVVEADRPDRLHEWVYADLAGLRERVRDISMHTTRGKLATLQANPPAALGRKLEGRQDRLLDVPGTYGSVPERARIAARTVYLNNVSERLARRAENRRDDVGDLAGELPNTSTDSITRMQRGYERRDRQREPTDTGLEMRVDAEPAYLTRSAVGHDTVRAIPPGRTEHPLVTKNWNVASLPYGDVVDAIVGAILGPKQTRLRSGAQVLRLVDASTVALDGQRLATLRAEVREGVTVGAAGARSALSRLDLGDRESRRGLVRSALTRWETPAGRALALTNGSAARAIHGAARRRWSGELSNRSSDLLALWLNRSIHRATVSDPARVPEPAVNSSVNDLRTVIREEVTARVGDAVKNLTRKKVESITGVSLNRIPAGLPLAPVPGFWYATANLWDVQVAGEYARFTVRVPRGTPDDPGGAFRYVRDAGTVRLDVDGDGVGERLGETTRLSFRTRTTVAIAVPPGPQGVGDVDGQAIEESAGWPVPGV